MENHSKAFDNFNKSILRCLALMSLYFELQKKTITTPNFRLSDIVRSAIVLSVSSMDSYFTSRFEEMLIPFLRTNNPTPKLISVLSDAGLDTEQALIMVAMKRPYRRIRTLVGWHMDKYVTQRFHKIDDLFLAFGYKNFCENVQRSVHRKNLLRRIEILVERRHDIVHEGDLNQHGRLRKVDVVETYRRIKDLFIFIKSAEQILSERLK